jgi:sugar/nucleoside kinase (ribokinase family)
MKVVCLGILVADVIGLPIDAVPFPGTLQLVSSITPHIGGCAANTGIGLAKLGVPCRVVGKVGRDGLGEFVQSRLQQSGVEPVIRFDDETPTSATMVLVSSHSERAFLHCTGANARLNEDDFDFDLLDDAGLLHIAGHGLMPRFDGEPCARILQKAQQRGVKTCLDTAGAPNEKWYENLRLCLPHLDYFVPSMDEISGLFPEKHSPENLIAKLLEAGVGVIGLKMGERGSLVSDGKETHHVPPFLVPAVDATGAGDAFAAGFLCGVLNGLDLRECARLGNAAGALCVQHVGTIAGYRSLEETRAFIGQHTTQ